MAQHIRRTSLFVLLIVFAVTFSVNAAAYQTHNLANQPTNKPRVINFPYGVHVDLHILFGFGYIFNCTTDFEYFSTPFSFNTPVGLGVDVRFMEWFSLYTALTFQYELQSFSFSNPKTALLTDYTQVFYHNLQLSMPVMIKFYPFVYKSDNYERMYFACGLIAHFSPARFYKSVVKTADNEGNEIETNVIYGNALRDAVQPLFPSACYVPANIGLRLSVGNTFLFKDTAGIGLEFFVQHLFIPTINGYLSQPKFEIGGTPFVDFNLTLGFSFSIAIRTFSSNVQ